MEGQEKPSVSRIWQTDALDGVFGVCGVFCCHAAAACGRGADRRDGGRGSVMERQGGRDGLRKSTRI